MDKIRHKSRKHSHKPPIPANSSGMDQSNISSSSADSSSKEERCSRKRKKHSRNRHRENRKKRRRNDDDGELSSDDARRKHRHPKERKRSRSKSKKRKHGHKEKKHHQKMSVKGEKKTITHSSLCVTAKNVEEDSISSSRESKERLVAPVSQPARSFAPMTKAEYDKRQSVVRRVFDPETGRNRLVKGDGEILEEIVSREQQKVINKQATLADGLSFQSGLKKLS